MPKPDDESAIRFTCATCGYALDHLPTNICPECGTAFDPSHPDTVRRNREKARGCLWSVPGFFSLGLAAFVTAQPLVSHARRNEFFYFLLMVISAVAVSTLIRAVRWGGWPLRLFAIAGLLYLAIPIYRIARAILWAIGYYWLP